MSGDEIRQFFADKGLCHFRPADESIDDQYCHVWHGEQRTRSFTNEFEIPIITNDLIDFRASGFCRHNGFSSPTYSCFEVFRVEDDLVAIVPDERDRIFWYQIVDRDFVQRKHVRARYRCRNDSKLEEGFCVEI